ncbi:MAG: 30S ribosomal protein S20 [Rhodothermales bacterium]|nr:30S ribosomal protein S20 [Rhodothermales bacterium]
MPQHKSAEKRVRQAETRRERNRQQKNTARTLMKKLEGMEDKETATTALNEIKAKLDRLGSKGVFKKNQVANYKSRLEKKVNSL